MPQANCKKFIYIYIYNQWEYPKMPAYYNKLKQVIYFQLFNIKIMGGWTEFIAIRLITLEKGSYV